MIRKLFIFVAFAILIPSLSAKELSIDLLSAKDGLQKTIVIPWGNKVDELKLVHPQGEDSLHDGPMNFYVLSDEMFIKEHLKDSYLVVDHKNIKNIRRINYTKNKFPLNLQKPEAKLSPHIISLRKKDSLFVLKTPATDNVAVTFVQTGVKSLVFLKEDSSENIHLLAESVAQNENGKISVERYWIEIDSKLKVKNLFKLPQHKLYHPENDIFITDNGEIFLIITDIDGLEIYKGGVK